MSSLFLQSELTALNERLGTNLSLEQLGLWIVIASERSELFRKTQSNYQNLLSMEADMAQNALLADTPDHIAIQNAVYAVYDSRPSMYTEPEFERPA